MISEDLKAEAVRFVVLLGGFTFIQPVLSSAAGLGGMGAGLFVLLLASPIFYFLLGYVLSRDVSRASRFLLVLCEVLVTGAIGELVVRYGPFYGAEPWTDFQNIHIVRLLVFSAGILKIGPAVLGVTTAFGVSRGRRSEQSSSRQSGG